MQINGIYSLQSKINLFTSCVAQHYSDNEIEIYTVNTTNEDFASSLASLYKEKGVSCINDVDEMFLAVVSDLRDNSIHIFSDITTSPLNMYYTVKEDKLYYSTSLKQLLSVSKIDRKMNFASARAFVANGYVFGKETLIENIYKLQFGCEITVENESVLQKRCPYFFEKISQKDGKKQLIPTIQEAVIKCLPSQNDIYMPLSGGYDSNVILNTVQRAKDIKVHAFTVGAKGSGTNEISAVKKNISHLENVELHESFVDTSFYDSFSDIIWRLEGFVFESGVFLQYALARSAKENGATYLICGEGSDETQSVYYYDSFQRAITGQAKENEKFFIYSDPFIATNMLILKKSSLMLNSFGIVGKYPFKHKSVSEVAISVAKLNGTGKKYYKKQCRNIFSAEIIENLKTRGGTTSNASAISELQMQNIESYISGNALIRQVDAYDFPIHTSKRTKKLRKKQFIERGMSEIKELGLLKGLKKALKFNKKQGNAKLLKQFYLVIFNELFITGKYDDCFDQETVPLKTDSILKGDSYEKV